MCESANEAINPDEDQYKVRCSIDKEDDVGDDAFLEKACKCSHDDLESGCSERDHEDKSKTEADILICIIIVRVIFRVESVLIVISEARLWIVIHSKGVETKDDCPEATPHDCYELEVILLTLRKQMFIFVVCLRHFLTKLIIS